MIAVQRRHQMKIIILKLCITKYFRLKHLFKVYKKCCEMTPAIFSLNVIVF